MASFQVEIVPSSPFFKNNLNNLDIADLWVHQPQWQTATDAPPCNNNNNNNNKTNKNKNNNSNNNDGEEGYGYEGDKGKDKWARAREIVFPANTTSPKASDNPNAGGVSSLVQKWKGFEAGAKRSSSSSSGAPPPPPLPPGPLPIEDDSLIGDWESDRTVMSGRSSIRGRDSDATESERLRVADIIRKLTPEAGSVSPPRIRTSLDQYIPSGPVSSARVRTSLDQQTELRCIAPAPRIRGRQAYLDLLAQRERDRRKELQGLLDRNAVSKFSHRGRIQAVLKIKLLRRGMEAKESGYANRIPFQSSSYKPPTMHFRQRVNEKAQNGPVHLESCRKEAKDNNTRANSSSVNDQIRKQEKQQQEVSNTKTSSSCVRAEEDGSQLDCRASRSQDDLQHNANLVHTYEATTFIREETRHGLAESAETNSEDEINKHKEDNHEATATNYDDLVHDHPPSHPTAEMMSCNEQIVESEATYWVADFNSHPEDGWEELQSDYQTKDANWIYEVSRPRSDWEYLRQERYQEMLDPFSENEEIRALLGRKSVSSFLSSGMREKIDQLMISRSQGQGQEQSLNNNYNDNSSSNNNNQRQDKRRQVVLGEGEGEDQYCEYFDEYKEAESSSKGQQHFTTECDEYIDPTIPQNENENGNGNGNQCHESSDQCSYRAVSPSTQQSSTNYCSLDMTGRNSSYSTHPTFDMEIIYDLRRHMEQLHQEISELRKSIKCCTDMQVKLHRSIKKEVSAALTHPDAKNARRHPVKKGTSGRRCCLCCKVQVDCLLYRCGHMCTCFDCANQLHWSTGTCPICRAQILDVVRIHSNS